MICSWWRPGIRPCDFLRRCLLPRYAWWSWHTPPGNLSRPCALGHSAGWFEGHPNGSGRAFVRRFRPEHQDVNDGVGNAVMTQRPSGTPRRVSCIPGLHPCPYTLLQVRDGFFSDAAVNILLLAVHGPVLLVWVQGIRTAENRRAGRNEAACHGKGNGQHGSAANGAGSAVDGTLRLAMVSVDWFGSTGPRENESQAEAQSNAAIWGLLRSEA